MLDRHEFSEHAHQKRKGDDGGERRCQGGELLLAVAPGEILDYQNTETPEQMRGEQKHQADLAYLHQRLIAPAQKAAQSRFALEREPERQKVQRQKDCERQPGDPVQHCGHPQRAAAMFDQLCVHDSTTAATARRPSAAKTKPKKTTQASMRRSLSGSHSFKILRTPIDA